MNLRRLNLGNTTNKTYLSSHLQSRQDLCVAGEAEGDVTMLRYAMLCDARTFSSICHNPIT